MELYHCPSVENSRNNYMYVLSLIFRYISVLNYKVDMVGSAIEISNFNKFLKRVIYISAPQFGSVSQANAQAGAFGGGGFGPPASYGGYGPRPGFGPQPGFSYQLI